MALVKWVVPASKAKYIAKLLTIRLYAVRLTVPRANSNHCTLELCIIKH